MNASIGRSLGVPSLALTAFVACSGGAGSGGNPTQASSDAGRELQSEDGGSHLGADGGTSTRGSDSGSHHVGSDSGGGAPTNPDAGGTTGNADAGGVDSGAADGAAQVDSSSEDPGASPPPGYSLVWEDLFDTGTVPDSSKWGLYDSVGNGGNGLRRPSAFSVHDGMVDVIAQMENGQLVSGGMAATYSSTFGYFEFRVRSTTDASQATDAVVLTWPDDGVWPEHGENDIYETGTGASRDPFNTFIHYGTIGSDQVWMAENADGTQWHVMGMEWTASEIAIYRDGTLVGTVTDTSEIPTWNHHPCIQLDAYQQTMGSPVHMYVDWIRVYQK
jgi:beta-glucanase (GH16 family)